MRTLILCFFLIGTGGLVAGDAPHAADTTLNAKAISELNTVKSGDLDRISVYYMPRSRETIAGLDGPALERACWGSVTVRLFNSELRKRIIQALLESSMKPSSDAEQDFRWGCVFCDASGKRLLSVYFTDRRDACVNDIMVVTDGKFFDFLGNKFSFLPKVWNLTPSE